MNNTPGGIGALGGTYIVSTNLFSGNPELTNLSGAFFSFSGSSWYLNYGGHQYYSNPTTSIVGTWFVAFGGVPVPIVSSDVYTGDTNSYVSTNLFSGWAAVTNSIYTNPPPQFSLYPVQVQITRAALVNFWPATGGRVSFHLGGWNKSTTNGNVINLFVGGLNVFRSPPTAGGGQKFNLDGTLDYDGTNLASSVSYLSGDPLNRSTSSSMLITNVAVTNLDFSFGLDSDMDTNVILTEGIVQSAGVISGSSPPVVNLVPTTLFTIPLLTVTNSTDSTFGLGAGIFAGDSNYLYLSVGTNLWKRVGLTNW